MPLGRLPTILSVVEHLESISHVNHFDTRHYTSRQRLLLALYHWSAGCAEMMTRQFANARKKFRHAVDADPNFRLGVLYFGHSFSIANHSDQAIRAYTEAAARQLSHRQPSPAADEGDYRCGNEQDADTSLEAAVSAVDHIPLRATDADLAEPWYYLGREFIAVNWLQRATDALRCARWIDPTNPWVENELGAAAFFARRFGDAARHFKAAVRLVESTRKGLDEDCDEYNHLGKASGGAAFKWNLGVATVENTYQFLNSVVGIEEQQHTDGCRVSDSVKAKEIIEDLKTTLLACGMSTVRETVNSLTGTSTLHAVGANAEENTVGNRSAGPSRMDISDDQLPHEALGKKTWPCPEPTSLDLPEKLCAGEEPVPYGQNIHTDFECRQELARICGDMLSRMMVTK